MSTHADHIADGTFAPLDCDDCRADLFWTSEGV